MRRDFGQFPVCIIKAGFKLYQFHTVINVIPLLPLLFFNHRGYPVSVQSTAPLDTSTGSNLLHSSQKIVC